MEMDTIYNLLYDFLQNGFSSIYPCHSQALKPNSILVLVLDTGNVYCAQEVSISTGAQ